MFKNEPFTDFATEEARIAFQEALAGVEKRIRAHEYYSSAIIEGGERWGEDQFPSLDPSQPSVSLGMVWATTIDDTERALKSLRAYAPTWADTPAEHRCDVIWKVGEIMRSRRMALAALMVREAGKTWTEADGDVAEAIDFCFYYADEMNRLAGLHKTMEVPGEDNFYFYQARGVSAVIAPWNFPLAIACGMTVASLVTGNTTALKPAEQTSIVAFEFANILLEAGVPAHAFAFLPGYGESVGRYLVQSPDVDVICFTGSKAVGLEIMNEAAQVRPGQRSLKKVIAELGGKNAIIVDDDADLDEAIKGVLQSAFGFAGQKCSACSRVIVVGDAYEPFLKRFAEATRDMLTGAASEPSTLLGPVIDEDSRNRLMSSIERAASQATLLCQGRVPEQGYFVPPTVFRDVPTDSFLWKDELFGPVLAVRQAKTFEEALGLANDSLYALTGGLFSRNPSHIKNAYQNFKVGNLYINRKITGALVCRQPFGGGRMSGVGAKAGGPDYLLQFLDPRTITENTMRRGFTPESR